MADKNKAVEQTDLGAIVDAEIASARNYFQTEISGKRSLALEYVQGKMRDLRSLPNRSTQVSRDVADTISWILPGIVRVFTGSDQMVEYEANREGGEEWAKDASDFTNYDFMRNNDGYRILYNSTYDALTLADAVVVSDWCPTTSKRETLRSQTIDDITPLTEDPDVEILSVSMRDDTQEIETVDDLGQPIIIQEPLFDVKIKRIIKRGHIKDDTLRPENLLINDTATTIEDARATGYRFDNLTRSDLMEMADEYGFDKETIKNIPKDGFGEDDTVNLSRYLDVALDTNSPVRSMDPIDLYRYFIHADVDDDGIAELVEVWYAGKKVLAWNVWEDDIPWTVIPCYPIPHRFDSESVADRTMDIQRVKTVLLRQALDNLYATNLPQREVDQGSVLNPDALVNPRFGGILWKKAGSAPIVSHAIPFTADKVFTALGYMDEVIAKRTGVSRTTMALDPEALQNQTATASQQQRDAGYSQIELIARNMAELGWAAFFKKRLKLAVKYQKLTMIPAPKEESKFRQINPEDWDENMGVSINVGLGTGSRDRDMSMLNTLMNVQTGMAEKLAAVPGAQDKAIEFIRKIMNTAVKLAESSGLRNPESYFPVITEDDEAKWIQTASQPPGPNPAIELEQVKGQIAAQTEQVKGQTQVQVKQIEAQVSAQEAQLKAQGEVVKNQAELDADLATKEADRQNAMAIEGMKQQFEREKLQAEMTYKYAELAQNRDLELIRIESAAQSAETARQDKANSMNGSAN